MYSDRVQVVTHTIEQGPVCLSELYHSAEQCARMLRTATLLSRRYGQSWAPVLGICGHSSYLCLARNLTANNNTKQSWQ